MKTKTEELTLARLTESFPGNISEGIEFAKTFYAANPEKPIKPRLYDKATSSDAKKYASDLEAWEIAYSSYKKEKEEYSNVLRKVDNIIEEYIKDAAGFNSIPESSKEKVWRKAWEDGHSSGYYEVYLHLANLVDLF